MDTTNIEPSLETVLPDGLRVCFRRIRPDDKHWLQSGIEAMSPRSRYRRFFAPVDHLSDEMLTYFTEVDHVDHVAWLGILADDPAHRAIAVARFVRIPAEPEAAEAAVTVLDDYQGRGLGKAMLRVIARDAIDKGIRRFSMFVLGENDAMMALLRQAGAHSEGSDGGVVQMHVDLPEDPADLDDSAAPRILRVAAEGNLRGEVNPAGSSPGTPWTRFLVGKQ